MPARGELKNAGAAALVPFIQSAIAPRDRLLTDGRRDGDLETRPVNMDRFTPDFVFGRLIERQRHSLAHTRLPCSSRAAHPSRKLTCVNRPLTGLLTVIRQAALILISRPAPIPGECAREGGKPPSSTFPPGSS